MKKLLFILSLTILTACGGSDSVDEDYCENDTCRKVLNVERRPAGANSAFQYYYWWELENVCTGDTYWYRTPSTNTPIVGVTICDNEAIL